MSTDLQQDVTVLARDILALYLRATELRRLDVAEHLLAALEELARSSPCYRDILDVAYFRIPALRPPDA